MLHCIELFKASFVFFLFSCKCHVSKFAQKWKCMRQVEGFAPLLDTAGGPDIRANNKGL